VLCERCKRIVKEGPKISFGKMMESRRLYFNLDIDQMTEKFSGGRLGRFKNLRERAEADPPVRLFGDEFVQLSEGYGLDLLDLILFHSSEFQLQRCRVTLPVVTRKQGAKWERARVPPPAAPGEL